MFPFHSVQKAFPPQSIMKVHDEGVVHVVEEVCRNGEVAETHHLLGCVDDDGVVDAGPVWLWILLQEEPGGEKIINPKSQKRNK